MGFAIMTLDSSHRMDEDQEILTVLQRQVAVSIYNAWLFRDLGEQRDALRLKTGELEKANSALMEADRFKSEFLALTSHELRTPLTGILGFTRLVMDGLYEDEEEMHRMLADSYASGRHLLDLLNDILDLAKIEAGRMQMHLEPWSIHVLMEEVKPIAMAYPRKPGTELLWPEGLSELPEVLVDPGRLRQVLLNLLSNAIKFTKEGTVRVNVERGFGQMTIQVVDTGHRGRSRGPGPPLPEVRPGRGGPFPGVRRHGTRSGHLQAPHGDDGRHHRPPERGHGQGHHHDASRCPSPDRTAAGDPPFSPRRPPRAAYLGGMPVHSVPPESEPPLGEVPAPEIDAAMEAWAQALKADARADQLLRDLRAVHLELKERSRQAALMRHVANVLTATARTEQLSSLILDVLQSEFGVRQGLLWALSEDRYVAGHGMGFDRRQLERLHLPAPHPFPQYPILIYQSQWLELESLPPALRLIQARAEDGLFFVPFEHQTLLVGFTVLSLPRSRTFSEAEQESLEVLQRLFAASLHGAWTVRDLQRQRERLRSEAEALKARTQELARQNRALHQGQSYRLDFMVYAAGELRGQLLGVLSLLSQARQDRRLSEEDRGSLLLDGLLAGKHMAELLKDLAELVAPGRGEVTAAVRPTDLGVLLASLRPLVETFPCQEGGSLQWPEELDLPDVLADGEVLKQVLLSLCAGALRNSANGSLRLWIEREPLSLVLRVLIEGLDLGEATASFNIQHPLRPEELYVKGQGGAGLGLVICRQLLVAMGGAFTLEREPLGAGTVIGLELPLA